MRNILKKFLNQETFLYLFFGVLTTIINYGVFAIGLQLNNRENPLIINIFAFVSATLFAYITNKIFVFQSKERKVTRIFKEILEFFCARLFSFAFEQFGLFIAIQILDNREVEVCGIDVLMLVKIVLSFIAVLMNYFVSKYMIFKGD